MYYFCTYFDYRYLPRGLALYRSLRQHCRSFRLWVLCLDEPSYRVLCRLGLADVHPVALEDFERGDEELVRAKQNRSVIEYYFTCTPSLPLFILRNNPEVGLITYLDADLFFFEDPGPIYEELGAGSVGIIAHRFPEELREFERFGMYNVGWVSFRRSEDGLACLGWWRERCLEWCYDRVEQGRFADQKYLDDWPRRFQGTVVLGHKGANVAPWNLATYAIRGSGQGIWVDEDPLIFFHFHGVKQISRWLYDLRLTRYNVKPSKVVLGSIYAPYLRALRETVREVSPLLNGASLGDDVRNGAGGEDPSGRPGVGRRVRRRLWAQVDMGLGVLQRRYLLLLNGVAI